MYIGIDIGGTNIKYGIINNQGIIIENSRMKTNHEKKSFLKDILELINQYQKRYPNIEGIGISAPGIIDKEGTFITAGSIQSLYGMNLKQEVEQKTGLLTIIENDANCAAIAEKWIGNAQDYQNYLCVVLGTGVGGGIVINNQIYRGSHGMAGEFGWTLIDSLPKTEEIETVSLNQRVSIIAGLCHQYNVKNGLRNGLTENILDAREIFRREVEGDVVAELVLEQFFEDLVVGLLNLISCFDPEAILIGGAISENQVFFERLQSTFIVLKKKHKSLAYLEEGMVAPLLKTKLKNHSGMIGAVYQVHTEKLKRQLQNEMNK